MASDGIGLRPCDSPECRNKELGGSQVGVPCPRLCRLVQAIPTLQPTNLSHRSFFVLHPPFPAFGDPVCAGEPFSDAPFSHPVGPGPT